jgi:hypothetical protein
MTKIEAVGLLVALITLFETGYLLGTSRARRQRAAAEDELIANRLKEVLGSVRIRKMNCESPTVIPGQTFPIALTVTSAAACVLEVWIGASLVHHSGTEHYDTTQDKPVMLEPGTKTYHRALTVPPDVAGGDYSLVVAVWLGKAGNPDHSIRLDRCWQEDLVKVREK